jgi:curli biogenesis system outer membrane secretion channel CsgG
MTLKSCLRLAVAGASLAVFGLAAGAASAQDARAKNASKMSEIPRCAQPIGVIAVAEPDQNWWRELGLGSPEALLKVIVSRSGCFSLVDRGKGMDAIQRERALASGGDLRVGSNIGQGQIIAADYVLVPDIVSQNANSSGTNIGGMFGGLVGGFAGAIVSGISLSSKTADVVLTITDVRSSAQLATIEGHGDKTDIGFSFGGGGFGGSGFGAAGATGYDNTEIGQVVTLAYIDAYSKLVDQLGGVIDEGGSANSPQQAVVMTKASSMFEAPSSRSKVVRPLDAGMRLYPTGGKDGLMWEVQDELGNKGWVTSIAFQLAR